MAQESLRKRFIEKSLPTVERINDIAGKLEKEEDKKPLLEELSSLAGGLINEAIANRELPVSFLLRKIDNLAKTGDYYLSAEFAKTLMKKIEDMKEGKPEEGIEPPKPENEKERLAAVRRLNLLDTPSEKRFDNITQLASKFFKVPVSTLTLLDENREWHKSVCGAEIREADRKVSFCGHTILEDDVLVIPDASKDPRFSNNLYVKGGAHVRFYMGMPLMSVDGYKIGTFCIIGQKPKKVSKEEIEQFRAFALWAELEINAAAMGKSLIDLRKSIKKKLGVS